VDVSREDLCMKSCSAIVKQQQTPVVDASRSKYWCMKSNKVQKL
jgi:hypothetical protein